MRSLPFLSRWTLVLSALAVLLGQGPARPADRAAPSKEAVDRTRKNPHVGRRLQGLRGAHHRHLRQGPGKTPAALVAKKVFKHMASKGWHTAPAGGRYRRPDQSQ